MIDFTQKLTEIDTNSESEDILVHVYEALVEKGYNPINQIVGYLISGDPTYITSHKNARGIVARIQRDELLELLVTSYVQNNKR